MDTACRQLRIWRDAGHDLHVSVNLSPRQVADVALPERIESLMVANAVPVGSLWLEVSEATLAADVDAARAVLDRTEMLGACMVIDDFGAGGASLGQVQDFPVHALKIDRVFVEGLSTNPSSRAIARSILSLGGELGLVVIAEGVETEAQLEQLQAMGCPLGQGFLFGRPEPAERFPLSPPRPGDARSD
jgi:EAL domain-containing protein (putative c-di-GMP-specific phosphodiesterase class I)